MREYVICQHTGQVYLTVKTWQILKNETHVCHFRAYMGLLYYKVPGSKGHAFRACMKKHEFGTRKT